MTALYTVTAKIKIKLIPESYYNMVLSNSQTTGPSQLAWYSKLQTTHFHNNSIANLNIYKYKSTSNAPVILL
jgi:hypothetical protein